MEEKQIIKIVCKSFGLWCLVYAFLDAKQLIFLGMSIEFGSDEFRQSLLYFGQLTISFAVDIAIAAVLIYRSDSIANVLIKDAQEKIHLGVGKGDMIQLVVIAIGGIAIVSAIPEILSNVAQYLYFNQYGRDEMGLHWTSSNNKTDLVYSIVKLAVGLIAISNGGLLARWIARIDRAAD